MIVLIDDEDLETLYQTGKGKGKYKKLARDSKFVNSLVTLLDLMKVTDLPSELPSRYHYEKLLSNMSGKSSVRVLNNRVERLLFYEFDGGIRIEIIELDQTHYGKK